MSLIYLRIIDMAVSILKRAVLKQNDNTPISVVWIRHAPFLLILVFVQSVLSKVLCFKCFQIVCANVTFSFGVSLPLGTWYETKTV